jgi:uncharacterized protein YndB with AHSA1/START domain
MDVADAVGATRRELRVAEGDRQPARQLVATRSYPTGAADLWDALTSPTRIPRWFMPITGDLRVGGRYQLEGNAGGEVQECDPPRRFAITWGMGDETSWVVVSLTPEGRDRTMLELEHTAVVPEEFWALYGPGSVGIGWDLSMLGLARHQPGEERLSHENLDVWMSSPEGLEFVAASNDAWAQANITGGADPAQALAGAEQTLAFYTAPEPAATEAEVSATAER